MQRADYIVGEVLKNYENIIKHLQDYGFYIKQEKLTFKSLKDSRKALNKKFELKAKIRNKNYPISKRYKEEVQNQLSKFKSRYEIAFYFEKISVKNLKNNPFALNKRERLQSYSLMLKFLLTYSAFESFCILFNYDDDLDKSKDIYNLIEKKYSDLLINSLKTSRKDKMDILCDYLIENLETIKLALRISVFSGKNNLIKLDKNNKNIYEDKYNKIYFELEKIFGKHKSYKHMDILSIPKAIRNKIAHGHLTASYSPRNKKSSLDYGNMIALYKAMDDLLFAIMDKKFNEVFKELKKSNLVIWLIQKELC